MTLRVCRTPGCGTLTDHGLCRQHRLIRDNSKARGYTGKHRQLRRRWAIRVAQGDVQCARCGQLIDPGEPWDLGHSDNRTTWRGPEHQACNRATRQPDPPGG